MEKTEPKIYLLKSAASHCMHGQNEDISAESIEKWLKKHKVIPLDSTIAKYADEKPWFRSGGETYLTRASVDYISCSEQKLTVSVAFVLKALIGLFPLAQANTWLVRRKILKKIGVPVSIWFDLLDGTIIEPFYPYGNESFNDPLYLPYLAKIAGLLDRNGFRTLHFLSDLRSDGKHIRYVDFGFDLGEPSKNKCDNAKITLQKYCNENGFEFPERYYLENIC